MCKSTECILVTGATGFVGRHILFRLLGSDERYSRIIGTCHKARAPAKIGGVEWVHPGPIGPNMDWTEILESVDVVVHAAARVHTQPRDQDAESVFHRVNTDGTIRLSQQAAMCGVRRFVFLSSVAVYGLDCTKDPLNEDSPCSPHSSYALSKYRAETGLASSEGKMDVVVVRPPLVYGKGAPGNFALLVKLVRSGFPLPFLGASNLRSIIGVQNLADFIARCIVDARAGGQSFVVADEDDVSIEQFVRMIAEGLRQKPRLIRLPQWFLRSVSTAAGMSGAYEKLYGSFRLDCRKARQLLEWHPPTATASGVAAAVRDDVGM